MNIIRNIFLATTLMFSALTVWAAPVDINSADAATMATAMKGIGLSKAQAIVKYRKDNGKFSSIDDLAQVKGIGKKTVEKNKDNITVKSEAGSAGQ